MKNTKNITKTYSRILLSALAAFGVTALSAHAAVVTWDNDGGAGDLEWGTDTNWDPATGPAASDIVIINNGDTVNITGNALDNDGSNLDVRVSGSSDLTFTGEAGAFQFNMNGAAITLGAGSTLSSSGDIRMWNSASLEFDDGADLNGTTEFRGTDAGLQFNLGVTGFTTVTAGNLAFWDDPNNWDLSDVNFAVDFENYTGEGATITLIDWTGGSGSQALLDAATQNFNNTAGYENFALTWDDSNKAIELSFTAAAPEPSTLALLGVGGAMLMAVRRRKSLCNQVM